MFSESLRKRMDDFRLKYPYKKWPYYFMQPEYQPINEAIDLLLDMLLQDEYRKTDEN